MKRSIGQVVELLKDEFGDITVSKLRFLESEGLVVPQRTDSGYRVYGDADVERVRYVLRQQRDHFLPLKVIRERLQAWQDGVEPDPEPGPERQAPPIQDATETELSDLELADAAGIEPRVVRALVEHGVLSPFVGSPSDPDGPLFDGDDLAAARLAAEFARFGVEGRHLRMFRQFAEREALLFAQVVSPFASQRNPAAQRRAEEIMLELADLSRRLGHVVLRQEIRRRLHP